MTSISSPRPGASSATPQRAVQTTALVRFGPHAHLVDGEDAFKSIPYRACGNCWQLVDNDLDDLCARCSA